jgi:hypothetical protein
VKYSANHALVWNASGTASAMKNPAAIAAKMIRRVTGLDVDRVRHPRVGRPRPPHHGEHENRPQESFDARVLGTARHLREREHEDEIEEKLN